MLYESKTKLFGSRFLWVPLFCVPAVWVPVFWVSVPAVVLRNKSKKAFVIGFAPLSLILQGPAARMLRLQRWRLAHRHCRFGCVLPLSPLSVFLTLLAASSTASNFLLICCAPMAAESLRCQRPEASETQREPARFQQCTQKCGGNYSRPCPRTYPLYAVFHAD